LTLAPNFFCSWFKGAIPSSQISECLTKKGRADEGSAFSITLSVSKVKSKQSSLPQIKVRLMVTKPTRAINEKLFLMPRVALTEETGIILARHLKSCKRRTPPQTP
jgi:prophage tail gpP-like protein